MFETCRNEIISFIQGSNEEIDLESIIEYYLENKKDYLLSLTKRQTSKVLLSEFNFLERKTFKSSEAVGFKVKLGDICYIDFGPAYVTEAGYQHFGIVIGYSNSKALVVPMSSNQSMYYQSYCEQTYPNGKIHLYRLPTINGLKKQSVLFLNDIKYINTARIISINGSINPKSDLFLNILKRTSKLI